MQYLLALDIGTSSGKAGLVTPDGAVVATRFVKYDSTHPAPGLAEQQPEDWWQAASAAARELLAGSGIGRNQVAAIGLSGQTPTVALVDRDGAALGPALTWQDVRGQEEARWLAEQLSPEQLSECFGAQIPVGASFPAVRVLWFRHHRPEMVARAARFVMPKDLVYFRLTGAWATDAPTWRGLLNLQTGRLDPRLQALLGISEAHLPPALPPVASPGALTPQAAATLGLSPGIPVAVGWPDSWSHMLGTGLGTLGSGFDVSGTSEVVGMIARPGAVTVQSRGLDSRAVLMVEMLPGVTAAYGGTQGGGGALDWIASLWPDGPDPYAGGLRAAAEAPAGSQGLLFLPYLLGERAPHWDPAARGVFFGLTPEHTRAHMVRAVLEGVAYSIRQVLTLSAEAGGAGLDRVIISGGPSRIDLWNQIKADVAGVPFLMAGASESGLLGAGIVASVAAGWQPDLTAALSRMVRSERTFRPDPACRARYDHLYEIYTGLYGQLKDSFHRLAQIPLQD